MKKLFESPVVEVVEFEKEVSAAADISGNLGEELA